MEAGGVGAQGAGGGAHLRAVGFDVGDEELGHQVRGRVAAEQDRAVVVLRGDDGGVAQRLQALQILDDALAEDGPAIHLRRGGGGGPIVAGELHAVGGLSADADVGGVVGEALAHHCALGIDDVAVEGQRTQAGGGVLHVGGEGADLGVRGVEAACLHNAMLPVFAIDADGLERADVDNGLGGGEVVLCGRRLKVLQRGLLGSVGPQGILIGLVGCGPQAVTDRGEVVVRRGQGDGAVAAAAAGVGGVAADAYSDADDALTHGLLAHQGAEVGNRLVAGAVVQAVLDEVGSLHAWQHQQRLLAVELSLHGAQHGIVLRGIRRSSSIGSER